MNLAIPSRLKACIAHLGCDIQRLRYHVQVLAPMHSDSLGESHATVSLAPYNVIHLLPC